MHTPLIFKSKNVKSHLKEVDIHAENEPAVFAQKKGVGSTKNGRDSIAKRLGVKRGDGQLVSAAASWSGNGDQDLSRDRRGPWRR